ncbi:hypothetical protein GCM10010435_34290 [Winogradskya consettensis]|uniref:Uncharacterized protein n=1 Tax=Winogradskya consettensis TaxID=113560 RepID=A0A919SDI8_9ACTN|nr:hypothetical protein [Actinoplanes consettensis]GIM69856.1 hypothetical protein Aco04nite_17200 [Actinoplanes consettensis]
MRRRTLLVLGAGAGVATALPFSLPFSLPATAAPASLRSFPVEGTDATVQLLPGPAATVFLYAARRFHYEIDTLHAGDLVGSTDALDLRPGWYAPGVTGGLLPYQVTVIRDIIAECDGLLAWGGDAAVPQEGRFTLTVAPGNARLRALAGRLSGSLSGSLTRGRRSARVGAGTALPYTEARRRRAEKIQKMMR